MSETTAGEKGETINEVSGSNMLILATTVCLISETVAIKALM